MLKVSKLADYAVVVLAALARNEGALLTASGISAKTGLPEPTVAKVLKLLARGGIAQSVRGVNGGYKAALRPEQISIGRIVSAVDGPVAVTACVEGSAEECGYQASCAVKGRWNGVNSAIRNAMESVTLADMMKPSCTGGCGDHEIALPAFTDKAIGVSA